MERKDETKTIGLFSKIAKMGTDCDSANLDILEDFQEYTGGDIILRDYDRKLFAIVLATRLNGADIEEWDNSDDSVPLYIRKRNELLDELIAL